MSFDTPLRGDGSPAGRSDNRRMVSAYTVESLRTSVPIAARRASPLRTCPHPHESLVPWGNHLVSMLLLKLSARDLFALNLRRGMVPHLAARWKYFRGSEASLNERCAWAESLVELAKDLVAAGRDNVEMVVECSVTVNEPDNPDEARRIGVIGRRSSGEATSLLAARRVEALVGGDQNRSDDGRNGPRAGHGPEDVDAQVTVALRRPGNAWPPAAGAIRARLRSGPDAFGRSWAGVHGGAMRAFLFASASLYFTRAK